jgi:hypothetical protein
MGPGMGQTKAEELEDAVPELLSLRLAHRVLYIFRSSHFSAVSSAKPAVKNTIQI